MNFYRMNGLGNEFNVFDLREKEELSFEAIKQISTDNYLPEKYDQLILILGSKKADAFMRIYNIDGTEASACGNATRCVARVLSERKNRDQIFIETINRVLEVKRIGDNYRVNMGKPSINWQDVPLSTELDAENLELCENRFGPGFAVNVGNPHLVFIVPDIDEVNLKDDLSHLATDPLFAKGANINVMEVINRESARLKTWERGAGATLACGTGACASFYAAHKRGLVGNNANIQLPGGRIDISIHAGELFMTGDAVLEEQKKINS